VLNDSYAWTEEIARYLLIWVTFFGPVHGGAQGVERRRRDLLSMDAAMAAAVLSSIVDVAAIALLRSFHLSVHPADAAHAQSMTSIDWPKSVIYWGVTFGLAVATLYAIVIAWRHWRTKSSPLIRMAEPLRSPERPGMD
jgi:TRAP-type transport system small permease protein